MQDGLVVLFIPAYGAAYALIEKTPRRYWLSAIPGRLSSSTIQYSAGIAEGVTC